jgi:hypothetical protein
MKKWLLIILALPVLFYCFLLLRSSIPVTVHDQDLQLVRTDIPAGSNAFDVLQEAGRHLWWPEKQTAQLYDLARDTNWDARLADTLLASNHESLAGWDAADKLPDFEVPEATNFPVEVPYLTVWKKLAQMDGVRENALLHNGQDQEGFDQIICHIQLARRMQNSHGVLISYLVGAAVNSMGLNQIQHWVGKTHLDAGQLKNYLHQLELDPNEESAAFANTVKAEYQSQVPWFNDLQAGKNTNFPPLMHFMPVINSSQTRALFANEAHLMIEAAQPPYNGSKLSDLESNRPGVVSMYLSGNAVGQLMFYTLVPTETAALAKKSQSDAQLQATRTILALRAYQLTHGTLPADLSALVPEFLDQVPTDDFDGQPLRYSRERKIVYSVGRNLKDDGGDDRPTGPSRSPLDLVYRFDF